jgi:membrane fusion protein, adhesin transport system
MNDPSSQSSVLLPAPEGETDDDSYAAYVVERVRPRAASTWMLWAILAFFVTFITWAAFAELDRTVQAMGRVVPNAQLQTISNLEGGMISEILVRPGQNVAAGQILIQLDQTLSGAEFGSGRIAIAALEARAARLTAEAQGSAPDWARAAFGPPDLIAAERALYATRMSEYASLGQQGAARSAQAQQSVQEARSQLAAREAAAQAAESEYQMIRPLVDRGLEPQMSLTRARGAALASASDASAARSAFMRAQAGIAEVNASARQSQQDWRARAGVELTNVRADLATRRQGISAVADRASRTAVAAPMAGKVNRILQNTIGGSVAPGAPLVEIVPSRNELIIEAIVDPKDISAIHMAQPARVSLTAYDSALYGALDGAVTTISPDATVNERTGQSFYSVRVKTKLTSLKDKNGKAMPITPGMVAHVSLLGEKRSVLSYMLSPLTRISQQALRE